jgi:hypothetical protein
MLTLWPIAYQFYRLIFFERLLRYVKTSSFPHPVQSVQCNAYQEQPRTYEHHNLTSPSAPEDTNQGFSECHLISSTPKPS